METRYIAARIDEQEWNGKLFLSAREAYDHVKTRSQEENHPITGYIVKPIEIEL